ncbi:sigma-54 dependent transcriptional regulator [Brevibacillus borstelensis]|uniref:sigma-54-dependent transcriptional regulator n=1 Tax=Brevibacillus TaxID=55080 RepID=UPI001D0B5ED7|nr:sigma-54 dependent transcriptional regulator [Brevibacillus borstelensis]MCC0566520.1 sigma-54 dependent transcriptional regulator [Brevibacillus borstelensis]MCM3561406.1 sigma-54 dependent transcriptional regulator [Brevibacillus borstelensis]MCM3593203.1 sigma-54 dependent transcriptional regulator [Brevibacillus borstelensis]MCM3625016.1 sigma-54 dependent transcriptional regulator [Brevibacillus borstelensis]MED1852852.1 sigma-54 dependent transcriptional regulator [Brevibacillus borst
MTRLLIVDDEPAICASLSFALEDDFDVFTAKDEQTALAALEQEEIDCVLLDLNLGSTSGLELLPKLKKLRPDLTVIMMTAFGTIESSVAAMKAGAYHYLTKPLHLDEVKLLINKALEFQKLHKRVKVLSAAVKQQQSYAGMIGKSQQMQRIYQLIEKVKDIPSNILITGESGTGKELVARAIHYQGVRSQAAFSVINCAAIPETLLESELFGYAKGAFTGAVQQKTGLFERSHGGTVFLDEIGEMPLALQAKLLRVIQERTVTPLGSYSTKEIDIRLIAATNRNLEEEVAKGTFREDLYYRLNVIPIRTPALRERPEDVPLLVDYFLDLYAANMGREKKECSPDVKKKLFAYSFPGNVRELANIIEYAVALSAGEIITMEDLPASLVSQPTEKRLFPKSQEGVFVPANATLEEAERLVILHTLEKNGGHRKKTADQLGISERGLRQKLKQYLES